MEKNTRILIIEDHEMIVWALKTRIKETLSDISVFWAPTFEQGLDLLKENWINLVILDIDIPGGNTPKMIPRLRVYSQPFRYWCTQPNLRKNMRCHI